MRVLVACEFSGTVREAFAARGHDAWSCDLLPTEIPGQHIEGDVLEVLNQRWDLMIAHPPCTYLCNSGVSWLHRREGRWELMREGAQFFKALLNAPVSQICIENPIMHGYAKEIIGRGVSQIIQPYHFGHGETKGTCLWLKNLPPLMATLIMQEREPLNWKMSPGPNRWTERSKTYPGIAAAMAAQWG